MNYTVDIIITLIAIAIVIYYTLRGFVRSVLNSVKLIASVAVSFSLVPMIFSQVSPWVRVAVYIIAFLIVLLLLSIIFNLIDRIIKKIPVIRSVNRIMGFFLGVGFAYIFISTITFLLFAFEPYFLDEGLCGQLCTKSVIFKFFAQHGAFSAFM